MTNTDVTAQVWRGTNEAQEWAFTNEADNSPFDLTGYTVRLRVLVRGTAVITLVSGTDAHLVNGGTSGLVTWTPTVAESRLIPRGERATYELERRATGVERPLCAGRMRGLAGDNDDAS